jgi:tetratricopeptide (TPR) repeat protein
VRPALGQTAAWVAALVAPLALMPAPAAGKTTAQDFANQVQQLSGSLKTAEDNLLVVEKQYAQRPEPTDDELHLRRFSDGEIQYLLGDYPGCSVLFYDLVSDKTFKSNPRYPDALFYLSDALYQQGNFIGAKLYLRELVAMRGPHYREALARYIELAGRLNEFVGIDEYIEEAKNQAGKLPPEVAYVYGKWLFKRTDLSLDERLNRVRAAFEPLASDGSSKYRLQSDYFIAVTYVQAGDYAKAISMFEAIAKERALNDREIKVKEMANLSLGRLFYETAKYDQAIDRYQEIPRESEYFPDSLYETAWAQVKRGEFEKAKNATEILKLVAEGSTLEPDAKILFGHLLLKLKKYNDANDAYNEVINEYAPVRDEVYALLNVNRDPVAYFDKLLARNERNLDVNSLLPPVALKWASTQREVTDAVAIINDLEGGRRGVGEGQDIANRLLSALDKRGMESFPALQEGYTRAEAVASSLTQADETLTRIEHALVEDQLSPEDRAALEKVRAQKAELAGRFSKLPTTQEELANRRATLQQKITSLDREAFQQGVTVQSYFAIIAALQKWLEDNKSGGRWTADDEKVFESRVQEEYDAATELQKQLEAVRKKLAGEKDTADTTVSGEDAIRAQYAALLAQEHDILMHVEGAVGPEAKDVIRRAHDVRSRMAGLQQRVDIAKQALRDQVLERGKQIREKIHTEQTLLEGYGQQVVAVSGDARQLVGRIAFDSFKRVYQQFYDLVLKADVGIVDVAFTRKQDNTNAIQKLSAQKDHELKQLDDEFKEVLKDVD